MISQIYRKYISKEVRDKIYDAFLGRMLAFFRAFDENIKTKFIYVFHKLLPATEENRLFAFMGRYGLTACPYPFMLKYKRLKIECLYDNQNNYHYIIHFGKRIYFPRTMEQRTIISSYRNLLIEQDERSPHRYVQDVNRLHGKILFDIGAAEGLFTLMCIEQVKYAYLFECETEWIEPLNLTFAPYKDKISIVRKYISDKNDEQNITIDLFLEDKDKSNLFLKMDIEGNEQAALRGAVKTLTDAKEIDFSICTYHRKNDAAEIADILASYGLKYEFTDGLIYYQKSFRKGIIRSKV